jgi:hypothetical protein
MGCECAAAAIVFALKETRRPPREGGAFLLQFD